MEYAYPYIINLFSYQFFYILILQKKKIYKLNL